jgi:hypothetical protein
MFVVYGSLLTILLTAFGLPSNFSVNWQKIVGSVPINGQICLDDVKNFDFKRIGVFTNHRPGKYSAWEVDGSFIPDENGRFIISVPAGNWVSMRVMTADPTVIDSDDAPDKPDNNASNYRYAGADVRLVLHRCMGRRREARLKDCNFRV